MTNISNQTQNNDLSDQDLSDQMESQVESVKNAVTAPLPKPPEMSGKQASAEELLSRLKWGEPALTIVDTRSREAFNSERIMGAVPMPLGEEFIAPELEHSRDIYIYGDTSERAAEAAGQFRQSGFSNVAEITGGLEAWKKVGGPVEGAVH